MLEYDAHSEPTIGDLVRPATPVAGDTLCSQVDHMFALDPGLNSIVAITEDNTPFLLDRREFSHHMAGPHGYGRMLHERTQVSAFFTPEAALTLAPATTILEANNALFARGTRFCQHDIMVSGVSPGGLGILSAAVLLDRAARLYAQQALQDHLTQLPNRSMLTRRLAQLMAIQPAHRPSLALSFVDLDRFKVVNDSLGHEAGDRLLVMFAQRLQKALGANDIAARLGGDEFALISEAVEDEAGAMQLGDRLLSLLEEPFDLDDHHVVVDASVGVAFAMPEDDVATLLRKADIAMYEAKRAGGGRCFLFSGDLDKVARQRLDLEVELRDALSADQIQPYYQPIVDSQTHRVVAMEALARWLHPERGLIPPGDFLPVAAETGLIVEIDALILREACREVAALRAALGAEGVPYVSVNVAAATLQRPEFAGDVRASLAEAGLPPDCLQVEITEGSMITSLHAGATNLEELKRAGVRIAIDDFGTGYSSLNHLRHFPFDVLKIDKSFVGGVLENDEDAAIVRLVMALAEATGAKVTAEGVETEGQAEFITSVGCSLSQGYLYARPMPASELRRLLAAGEARAA